MSLDPGLDLFKAVIAAIAGDTYLNGKFAGRVTSSWSAQDLVTPFARLKITGQRAFEMDGAGEGEEIDFNIHVYTVENGPKVVREICANLKRVLNNAALALDGSSTISFEYRGIVTMSDDQSPTLQIAIVKFAAITAAD